MGISLHRLKLLRELSHRGTVTAVAEALHYTTSAVSQQLALLERETGTRLLERRGRRVVLTEAGRVLAEHAESILAEVERAGLALESMRERRTVTLVAGVWASVAAGLLPIGLAKLAERAPEITVRSVELLPEDTAGAVRDGTLDLSFIIDYSNYPMPRTPQLSRIPIAVERMHVAVRETPGMPESIELAALATRPWILADRRSHFGRASRLACREAGFDPEVRHLVGEQSTALALVAADHGVTLVSDLATALLPAGVALIPLADPFARTVSIAYRTRDRERRPLHDFIAAMTEASADLGLEPPSYPPGT